MRTHGLVAELTPFEATTRLGIAVLTVSLASVFIGGCITSPATSPSAPAGDGSPAATEPAPPTASTAPTDVSGADLVIVGRIVTMTEPPLAEALLIVDGRVSAIGTRDEVLALANSDTRVMELGDNVAYPGFIDAHAHWIGDREYYDIESPAEAMDAAIRRGWTSISEQWNDSEKLDQLESLATADALPLRVDAYLALSGVRPGITATGTPTASQDRWMTTCASGA